MTNYGKSFFDSQSQNSLHAARAILPEIFGVFSPRSVVDVGCGLGTWLRVALELGASSVLGIDGRYIDQDSLHISKESFIGVDLATQDLRKIVAAKHDIAICMEVAEHLPYTRAASFVEELTCLSDVVLFSAAIPFQFGTGHLNEQWPEFWAILFGSCGYDCYDFVRRKFWARTDLEFWYPQNTLVFVRRGSKAQSALPCPPCDPQEGLALVHPENFLVNLLTVFRTHRLRAYQEEKLDYVGLVEAFKDRVKMIPPLRSVQRSLQDRNSPDVFPWTRSDVGHPEEQIRRLQSELRLVREELMQEKDECDCLRQIVVQNTEVQSNLKTELNDLKREISAERALAGGLTSEIDWLRESVSRSENALAQARKDYDAILRSNSWKAMKPLRAIKRLARGIAGRTTENTSAPSKKSPQEQPILKPYGERNGTTELVRGSYARAVNILFISGEPSTPGHVYRVLRYAESANKLGFSGSWRDTALSQDELSGIDIVFIWRARMTEHMRRIVGQAREQGATIVYDIDDYMFDPKLPFTEAIDAIRSNNLSREDVSEDFRLCRELLDASDMATASTEELAGHIRKLNHEKPVFVLPNGIDDSVFVKSRLAHRAKVLATKDSLVRIGYASGSRTHQKDFGVVAPAIGRILRERDDCRLVLFKAPDGLPILDPTEFPELVRVQHKIEWRYQVPLEELPGEIARFDINLVPLETGNQFCESKSELKYFEASVASVCTVASSTGPYRRAIKNGITGFTASDTQEWYEAIRRLVDDRPLRTAIAQRSLCDAMWRFGELRRTQLLASVIRQVWGGVDGASAFELDYLRGTSSRIADIETPEFEVVYSYDALRASKVSVIVPSYNYQEYIVEALDSVYNQTLKDIDLIVVDDCSQDKSLKLTMEWAEAHAARFNRVLLVRNKKNSGLAKTRNVGFLLSDTPFVLPLDADNVLYPYCCSELLETISVSACAFSYPIIEQFGDAQGTIGTQYYFPQSFIAGNYIDAMALIRKDAWVSVGGYSHIQYGWEDYDMWCKMAEKGLCGIRSGTKPLAGYRVHGASMLHRDTDVPEKRQIVSSEIGARHPWTTFRDMTTSERI